MTMDSRLRGNDEHKFSAYSSYKDSGVEWLGEVPKHWGIKRVKELGSLVLGKMLDNKQEEKKFLKPYLKSKNIGWLEITDSNIEEMYFSPYEMKLYRIQKGDLLFSEGGEVGKTAFWNQDDLECYIQNSVHKFTTNKNNNTRYFLYLSFAAGHAKFYDSIVNFVSIKHLTKEKLARVVWLSPPLSEQQAIANYLDTKTAQIDRKIELLSQKAEKYAKLKQSLINETVTRGLDKSVPMKGSQNEWHEELPINWSEKRVKDLFKLITDMAPNNNNHELLSVYASIGVRPRKDLEQRGNKASSTDGYWLVKKGDIIVNKLLAWMGGIGLSEYDGVTSPAYDILRKTNIEVCERYYGYLFRTEKAQEIFKRYSRGIMDMRLRLYFDKFGGIRVSVPPLSDQQAIAAYLDENTLKIDQVIKTINSQINNLKELRKTLINDVVTGKIKVVGNG